MQLVTQHAAAQRELALLAQQGVLLRLHRAEASRGILAARQRERLDEAARREGGGAQAGTARLLDELLQAPLTSPRLASPRLTSPHLASELAAPRLASRLSSPELA